MDRSTARISSQDDMVKLLFGNPFVPKKYLLTKNCSFLKDGNEICKIYSKQFVTSIDNEAFVHKEVPEFKCGEKGCQKVFTTVYAHELHYWSSHLNYCTTCKKQFLSDLLLQNHIEEVHDSFLKAAEEKYGSVYGCFITDCKETFQSTNDRAKHLVRAHSISVGSLKHRSQILENKMDTTGLPEQSASKKKVPRVPRTICFGRGAMRSFIRPISKNSQRKESAKETDITMSELADSLP